MLQGDPCHRDKARWGLRSTGVGGGTAILNRIRVRVRVRESLSFGTFEQRSEGGKGDSQADIQQEGVPGGGTGQCKSWRRASAINATIAT